MDFDAFLRTVFEGDLERFLAHPRVPMFIRANALKATPEAVEASLARYGVELERAPLDALPAFRVQQYGLDRPPGVCLPHLWGDYVIQSLGSMLPPLLLDPQPGEQVLDLCAAPGSKTSQIAAMMQGRGHLWANELAGRRINPLASTIDAIGAANISILNSPGERLPKRLNVKFDRILADVPCSGLGRLDNVDANRARWEKRGGKPSNLPELQYRLLLAALKMLKEGGRIVYSTCSLDPAENEAIIHQLVSRLPVRLVEPPPLEGLCLREGLTEWQGQVFDPSLKHARRLTPYDNPTEGFFAAILESTGPLGDRFTAPENPTYDEELVSTLTHDDEEVVAVIDQLSSVYGVERSWFEDWRYHIRTKKGKMTLIAPQIEQVWRHGQRHGVSMAVERRRHWRFNHSMIQRLGENITRNRVDLDPAQLRALIADDRVTLRPSQIPETPHPAVAAEGFAAPFVSGYVSEGVLSWKPPRRYVLPDPAHDGGE